MPARLRARAARRRSVAPGALLLCCALLSTALRAQPPVSPCALAFFYSESVDRRLDVPVAEQQRYGQLALNALHAAGLSALPAQYLLLVDRSPQVQAMLLYWMAPGAAPEWIGASPVSTGRPGSFDHFETPLGVFAHGLDNPDFRAEGTKNENGIRGYGARGMRVFDFGWQQVPKGWGDHAVSTMRLQMHATDADRLEQRLGSAQSKGCVRIPATLNTFLDHYGLLDADYDAALQAGAHLWVLDARREPTPWPGRYLVVVDSGATARPPWATPPAAPH